MLERIKLNVTPLNLLTAVVFGVVAYKSLKGWQALAKVADEVLDPVLEGAAQAYVDYKNPLVKPQIKFKSKYFNDFKLTPQAFEVIKKFTVLFDKVFLPDGTIKGEYVYIIDNNTFYSDDELPTPEQLNRGYNVTSF